MKPAAIPVRRGTHVAVRRHRSGAACLQRPTPSSGGAVQQTVPGRRLFTRWRPGTARNERKSSR